MQKLLITIKNFLFKYYLIILGLVMFSVYFWSRFLRSRTSKDLPPLELSVLRFIILLYICCIFSFILFSLLVRGKNNPIIENFTDWLFIPIAEFDKYLKSFYKIKTFYDKYLDLFLNKFSRKTTNKLEMVILNYYILFWILPRLILLTTFFIDVMIFSQLHYKYYVILFGLFLFFNKYFKYSLKETKKNLLVYYAEFINTVDTDYCPGVHPNPEFDEDADYSCYMPLPLANYIEYQTNSIIYTKK